MLRTALSLFLLFSPLLMMSDLLYAAHLLEPLGTEIAATPPRGRMFGQIEYAYSRDDLEEGEQVISQTLPVEFEVGVGERSQINLEAEVLLRESEAGEVENGIEEVAFGLKHRFLDETETLPDTGFLVEFAPHAGLEGDGFELKSTLLATKNLTSRFLIHLESGYLFETGRQVKPSGETEGEAKVDNANIFVYNVASVYRAIPDRLLFLAELNGESNFGDEIHSITIAPEIIYVIKNLALKLAVPIGVTDEAPDIGFHFGISIFFR